MSTSMRHHSTAHTYTDRAHNQDMDDDGGAETYGARRSARNSKQRHPVCMHVGVRCVREGKVEASAAHARQGHNLHQMQRSSKSKGLRMYSCSRLRNTSCLLILARA